MIELFRQNFVTSRFDQKKRPNILASVQGIKTNSKKMIPKKGLLCSTILKKGYTEKLFPSPQKSILAVSPNKFYHTSDPLRPLVCGILTLADNAGDYSQIDQKGGRGDA